MSRLTPEEYASLSPRGKLVSDAIDASRRGDEETSWALLRQIDIPAETLMMSKLIAGADWIRSMGLKTATAEAKYGKNWLDE